ncbi:hypothetical protein JCM17380_38420 [Desulfosporosinus burensis]
MLRCKSGRKTAKESWSLKTKQQGQPMRETRKSFKINHERIIFFNNRSLNNFFWRV